MDNIQRTIRGKKNELVYLAGIIDGEGTISITKTNAYKNKDWSPVYNLKVSCINKNYDVISMLKKNFGGWIGNDKICWRWSVTCLKALKTIKMLIPFLIIKNKQAQLGLEYYKKYFFRQKNGFSKGGKVPFLLKNIINKREEVFIKMRNLNKNNSILQPQRLNEKDPILNRDKR